MNLIDFIEKNYPTKVAFAKAMNTSRQQVNNWIKMGCIVKGKVLYRPIKKIGG